MSERQKREDTSLSRRERERLRRRRAMLRAAQAVFAEKGFAGATIDEIAEQAEFGKGTIYNYFEGGKKEMLFAIFDTMYDGLHALITEVLNPEEMRHGSPRAAFHELVHETYDYFVKHQELFFILMKEGHRFIFGDDQKGTAYFLRQKERMVEALVPAIEAAQEAGHFKPLPSPAVAHLLMGNIQGCVAHVIMGEHDTAGICSHKPAIQSSEEAADFLTTLLFDGLLSAPASANETLSE